MILRKFLVADFYANDCNVANSFVDELTAGSEHRFQAWEDTNDHFNIFWYHENIGDDDDLPKAVDLLNSLLNEDLRMRGIFEFKAKNFKDVVEYRR